MVYTWYILPIGGLYGTYHLLREPGNSIDHPASVSGTWAERISPHPSHAGIGNEFEKLLTGWDFFWIGGSFLGPVLFWGWQSNLMQKRCGGVILRDFWGFHQVLGWFHVMTPYPRGSWGESDRRHLLVGRWHLNSDRMMNLVFIDLECPWMLPVHLTTLMLQSLLLVVLEWVSFGCLNTLTGYLEH